MIAIPDLATSYGLWSECPLGATMAYGIRLPVSNNLCGAVLDEYSTEVAEAESLPAWRLEYAVILTAAMREAELLMTKGVMPEASPNQFTLYSDGAGAWALANRLGTTEYLYIIIFKMP